MCAHCRHAERALLDMSRRLQVRVFVPCTFHLQCGMSPLPPFAPASRVTVFVLHIHTRWCWHDGRCGNGFSSFLLSLVFVRGDVIHFQGGSSTWGREAYSISRTSLIVVDELHIKYMSGIPSPAIRHSRPFPSQMPGDSATPSTEPFVYELA